MRVVFRDILRFTRQVVQRCADFHVAKTSPGVLRSLAVGFVVALLGTINLWKFESLRSLVPFDMTLGSVVLAAAVTLFVLLRRRLALEQSWSPLLIGFALFTPALFATSLANSYSLTKTRALFTLCFLAAAAPMVLLRSEPRQVGFVRMLGAFSVLISAWLLIGGAVGGVGRGGLQVEDANPIAIGRMACLGSVVFALTVLRARGRPRLLSLAGFVVCTVAAVATGSRGPLAAAVIAVALVFVLTGSGRSTLVSILTGSNRSTLVSILTGSRLSWPRRVMTMAVLAVGAWLVVTQFALKSALDRIFTAGGGASDVVRVRLATESLNIAWNNWGGVGWGDLGDYLSSAARTVSQGSVQYPHNVIIEALVEGGVFGLLGLLMMLWVSWRRLQTNAVSLNGQIMLGLWILALGSALTSGDLIGNRLMWMMVGVGLALPSAAKRSICVDLADRVRRLRHRRAEHGHQRRADRLGQEREPSNPG